MKFQALIIPEKLMDVLTLIIVISITFGMYILYAEFKVLVKRDENINLRNYNFAQVFIGDKCILYNNLSKGILDYNKIKSENMCINLDRNITIIIDNEKIIFGNDCEKTIKKISLPIIVVVNSTYKEAQLLVC